ncbi:MAG TPA: diaminopimelate epimerase [Mariprofundaceae bacterium]|nr:diaminopimelate epimerase [Mariprofundaceae bacterium]
MSALPFTKMQAQGNDFVILNGLKDTLPEITESLVRNLTERRYGIGCDQLLVLKASDKADAAMHIFNNDGSEAANCGNGLRCVADLLIRDLRQDRVTIALKDRFVHAGRSEKGIRIEMGAAKVTDQSEAHVDIEIGNPHRVFFEATEEFPHDRNVEIVTGQVSDHVYIDIIERGAGRTPACGSGACATAAAIWHVEGHTRPQTIEMPGGEVVVSGSPDSLILEGEVQHVFSGKYQLAE